MKKTVVNSHGREHDRKIIQITPCSDWFALYKGKGDQFFLTRLLGWAIVEDSDGIRHVEGLDAADMIELSESQQNFIRYVHEKDIPSLTADGTGIICNYELKPDGERLAKFSTMEPSVW